jgi:hypothetical protein
VQDWPAGQQIDPHRTPLPGQQPSALAAQVPPGQVKRQPHWWLPRSQARLPSAPQSSSSQQPTQREDPSQVVCPVGQAQRLLAGSQAWPLLRGQSSLQQVLRATQLLLSLQKRWLRTQHSAGSSAQRSVPGQVIWPGQQVPSGRQVSSQR